jgi:hypothetical protein
MVPYAFILIEIPRIDIYLFIAPHISTHNFIEKQDARVRILIVEHTRLGKLVLNVLKCGDPVRLFPC